MKRQGNLYPRICDFENIELAARHARRGKRFRSDVLVFNHAMENNLIKLEEELLEGSYTPGPYTTFVIYEPKRRYISAAPYRDRVVHHALCNIIEPIFDRSFLPSSYANRTGKGTHKALDHFVALARKHAYCLRADIQQYFPSIDHEVLKEANRSKIKCAKTLHLIDRIIEHSNPQEECALFYEKDEDLYAPLARRRGLPIGNLTSQLWANVYLNDVDHAMAARYGGRRYLRYVDDFALFSDDREELEEAKEFLALALLKSRLFLHPVKTAVTAVKHGVNFLGFRIFPDLIRVRQENLKRARKRLRGMQAAYRDGNMTRAEVSQSIRSWVAHVSYGDTWKLRERVFDGLNFVRS